MRRFWTASRRTALALTISIAAATLAHAQAPPAPIDIDCAWKAMPDQLRLALVSAAPSSEKLSEVAQANQVALVKAATACHIAMGGVDDGRFGGALTAKTLVVWSSVELLAQHNITSAALEQAWQGLPAADRAGISQAVMSGGTASDAQKQQVRALAAQLGASDAKGLELVSYFIAARSLEAAYAGH